MDRRNFMRALFGVGAASVVASTFAGKAEASTLLDELTALDKNGATPEGDLPAAGAEDAQYYYRGRRRAYRRRPWARRPWRRRRVRRCYTTRNRWGRLVRRCVVR